MNPNTHFYLYSKNWYKQSDDKIEDLKLIMANYTGLNVKYITERDTKSKLISLAHYILDKQGNNEYLFSDFVAKIENKGVIEACLFVLESAIVNDENLGKPSNKVLPLLHEFDEDDENQFNWSD